ncbi:hypothetical protein ColLi_08646 [Colletotrichum liriopes]|uniref:Uncharacterized protein n=1 Tax=Colletotrichum liriopes TaxID=708192 RepID=A0AA37GTE0_9PEZI|nr:hypothetical protein ColLi_08646 [Colletotrichum liriopes]
MSLSLPSSQLRSGQAGAGAGGHPPSVALASPRPQDQQKKLTRAECTSIRDKGEWHTTMDFLIPPLELFGDEFMVSQYNSTIPVDMKGTILKGDHVIFSLDFETLCRQIKWANVNMRHPVPCEYGQCIMDMRVIKNGIPKPYIIAKAANAAADHTPPAVPGSSGFFFPPSLDNPGDRGYNWTGRARTNHFIVDEFWDHYDHSCLPDCHVVRGAHGKSNFVSFVDLGKLIQAR